MSTSTDKATATGGELRLVSVAEIQVEQGANPRRRFDQAALQELADSISQHGVIQPLVVRSHDGGYTLIAGERRYRAAKLAGLHHVPVTVRAGEGSTLELAVDENLHRQDLDPVEEAHAFDAILRSRKLTKKLLAERVSKNQRYVSERLRLLDLPEAIHEHVASGLIPLRLAKRLIEIAKVSEQVAVCCVQLVAKGEVDVNDLERRPERVIGCLGDHDWPDPQPYALAVSSYHHYKLESVLPDGEGADIRERCAAFDQQIGFCFDSVDADAARSYGCLLEFKDGQFWSGSHITDSGFVADRIRLKLDQLEAEQARREREASARQEAGSAPLGADPEKERQRLERQQQAEVRKQAVAANFELGRKLQLRYDAPKVTAPLARLLALLVFDGQADKLAGRGLRYSREDWQIVETKESRGKPVEKARYPEGWEAAEQLYAWIARARTPEQIVGRLLQALLAAHVADQDAVAASSRVYWHLPDGNGSTPSSEIPELLDRFAKPVLPRPVAQHNSQDEQPAAEAKAA